MSNPRNARFDRDDEGRLRLRHGEPAPAADTDEQLEPPTGDPETNPAEGEPVGHDALNGNIGEVLAHAEANPEQIDDMIAAEQARGDNARKSLIPQLEALKS